MKIIKNQKHKGQTMMEYIILVALLGVASIPVVKILGDILRDRVASTAEAITNGQSVEDGYRQRAQQELQQMDSRIDRHMGNFHER